MDRLSRLSYLRENSGERVSGRSHPCLVFYRNLADRQIRACGSAMTCRSRRCYRNRQGNVLKFGEA